MADKNIRNSAFTILCDFEKNAKWSDLALDSEIKKQGFDKRDAALLCEIVYGVIENKLLCDYYIEHFANRKINKIAPAVLNILRISIYQIIFLDKIPHSAAVNQGVETAKKRLKSNSAAAGFINAVLRRAAADAQNLPPISGVGKAEYLSIKFSHPLWFVRQMCERLGCKGAESLLAANNSRPPITVRVNTLKINSEQLAEKFKNCGIEAARNENIDNCLTLSRAGDICETDEFKNGLFYIQDAASQYAAKALCPKPGQTVVDMCAAPGGKSILAAQLMENKGRIYAFDLYEHKVKLILQNAKRMDINIISADTADSCVFNPKFEKTADKIICDVPCSGTGVIRKKPEIRYKKAEDIDNLSKIQQKILKNAAGYLKNGGEMIYSTCSVMKSENEDIITAFLKDNGEYSLCPFEISDAVKAENGMITLFPHIHNTDGFFIAKIKRNF